MAQPAGESDSDALRLDFRTLALPEAVAQWSLTSLREKLIKIGAKVVSHCRYVTCMGLFLSRGCFGFAFRSLDPFRAPGT